MVGVVSQPRLNGKSGIVKHAKQTDHTLDSEEGPSGSMYPRNHVGGGWGLGNGVIAAVRIYPNKLRLTLCKPTTLNTAAQFRVTPLSLW